MSDTSHILGLHENDLFYGKIQMALVLVRTVIAVVCLRRVLLPKQRWARALEVAQKQDGEKEDK